MTAPFTLALADFADRTNQSVDLTVFETRERALNDAFAACLARDDAGFDEAMRKFDAADARREV